MIGNWRDQGTQLYVLYSVCFFIRTRGIRLPIHNNNHEPQTSSVLCQWMVWELCEVFVVVTGNTGDNANIAFPFDQHTQKPGWLLSRIWATGSQRCQVLRSDYSEPESSWVNHAGSIWGISICVVEITGKLYAFFLLAFVIASGNYNFLVLSLGF